MEAAMTKQEAVNLLGIIQREGDKSLLDLQQLRVEGRAQKYFVSCIGRQIGPLAFHTYEAFIGTKWHDIERPEREDRERDEAAMWRNLSRVDARVTTMLDGAASMLRRTAEEIDQAAKQLSQDTDRAIESGSVEGLAAEFHFRVNDILRRLQNLPANALVIETATEKVAQIGAICAEIQAKG